MEHGTGHIAAMVTLDKRETGGSSVAMEKEGLKRAVKHLQENNMTIEEVVTDAHSGITAMMSKYAVRANLIPSRAISTF